MNDTYSFTFDCQAVAKTFHDIEIPRLVLALLARNSPAEAWEGCLIYEGESPESDGSTACVGTSGPGAEEVLELLVVSLEEQGIPVMEVYEGGPEVRTAIARAFGGKWV